MPRNQSAMQQALRRHRVDNNRGFRICCRRIHATFDRSLQAMVIVVASPRLLEPECRTPQMQLANALCRYFELAEVRNEQTQ